MLFAVVAGLAAPLMIFVPRAPSVLAVTGALGGAVLLWRRGLRPVMPDRTLLWMLAGLPAWAAMTAAWAIVPGQALSGAVKLAANLAVGMVLVGVAGRLLPRPARLAARWIAAGCGMAAVVVAAELLTGARVSKALVGSQYDLENFAFQLRVYGAFWFNAVVSLLALMVWPVLLTWRRLPLAVLVATVVAIALLAASVGFATGTLALVAGTVSALLVWKWRQGGSRLIAGLLVLGILTAPLLPLTVLDPERISRTEGWIPTYDLPRLYIWAFAAEHVMDRPLLGWGMNASRNMPGGEERIVDHIRDVVFGEVMPLHPHNFALQAWLELGLIGALLVAGITARLIVLGAAPARSAAAAAAATGLTVTALTQFALSYGAWQSWWLASVFLAAASLVVATRAGDSP